MRASVEQSPTWAGSFAAQRRDGPAARALLRHDLAARRRKGSSRRPRPPRVFATGTSRNSCTPSRRLASSHWLRRVAVLPLTIRCLTPESMTTSSTLAAAAHGRSAATGCRGTAAAPALPRPTTIWSMMPSVGAPTSSFSAHFPAIASLTFIEPQVGIGRAAAGGATLTSSAALEGQPAADRHRRFDAHVDAAQVEPRLQERTVTHLPRSRSHVRVGGLPPQGRTAPCAAPSSTLALHHRTLRVLAAAGAPRASAGESRLGRDRIRRCKSYGSLDEVHPVQVPRR